ncbi:Scr1 family TA system antitoxin-like transcriptional regulator [Haloactinomyces albus]|uniref:DUF5753 domain-containing protein n=1 Tax=Haloactinomyces albus TaxID=1352928 RepID=A0AAE3ZG32_9ACTN|nr:Scr1 family TA system antitoxin-like transcriptional regulator [Haloactinomyces albus]MDR7303375.1 hypothetical protein [Haloactinomyces albus]
MRIALVHRDLHAVTRGGIGTLYRALAPRLAEATLPTVTIQVVQPESGPHAAMGGSFFILDFAEARPIAYTELLDGAIYVQDPDQVSSYTMAAKNVQETALQPDDSLAFIRSLLGET